MDVSLTVSDHNGTDTKVLEDFIVISGSCEACPTCDDGILNGNETEIDCGGPDCDACPTSDITTSMTMIPSTANGTTNVIFKFQIQELANFDTDGDITLVVPKDGRLTTNWDPNATMAGPFPVDNASWDYDGSHPSFHIWTTNEIILSGGSTSFGFESTYDPQGTTGQVSYTGTIIQNSGGEGNGLNNIDSETIIYFSN